MNPLQENAAMASLVRCNQVAQALELFAGMRVRDEYVIGLSVD